MLIENCHFSGNNSITNFIKLVAFPQDPLESMDFSASNPMKEVFVTKIIFMKFLENAALKIHGQVIY